MSEEKKTAKKKTGPKSGPVDPTFVYDATNDIRVCIRPSHQTFHGGRKDGPVEFHTSEVKCPPGKLLEPNKQYQVYVEKYTGFRPGTGLKLDCYYQLTFPCGFATFELHGNNNRKIAKSVVFQLLTTPPRGSFVGSSGRPAKPVSDDWSVDLVFKDWNLGEQKTLLEQTSPEKVQKLFTEIVSGFSIQMLVQIILLYSQQKKLKTEELKALIENKKDDDKKDDDKDSGPKNEKKS
jgi:hypothetical protein